MAATEEVGPEVVAEEQVEAKDAVQIQNDDNGEICDVEIPSIDQRLHSDVQDQLKGLADSFEGFEQGLTKRKQRRKDDEEKRILALHVSIEKIEMSLKKESKRRQETSKALEAMFYDRLTAMKTDVEVPIYKRLEEIQVKKQAIRKRIKKLEEKVEQDRKDFPKQIRDRSRELLKQLKEFKARFKAEQVVRENREKELVKQIGDEHVKVHDKFEVERFARDQKFSCLDVEIADECRVRRKEAEMMKEHVTNEFAKVKVSLEECNTERVRATGELVKGIVHYAAALQDGVNIVSSS